MKNVYLVTGSEDGVTGIFGSKAKAFASAKAYCKIETDDQYNAMLTEMDERRESLGMAWTPSNSIWFFEESGFGVTATVSKEYVE